MTKQRADLLLVARGLADSRSRAQALIMAGVVFSGERKIAKAGELIAEDAPLEVRGKDHPWVSRGGIKLDHGLSHFGFDCRLSALDVVSRRRFTMCSLPATRPRSRGRLGLPAGCKLAGPRLWCLSRPRAHLTRDIIPYEITVVVLPRSHRLQGAQAPRGLAKPGALLGALANRSSEQVARSGQARGW